MRRTFVIVACLLLLITERSAAVARFEVTTVSANSIVIRMIRASNVSRFDMTVNIFDLDRLIEFRQTELSASRHDKLFSFDGLTPSTWFAIRIQYRLVFQSDRSYSDFITKQELIVRTKNNSHTDWRSVDDQIIRLDGVTADEQHIDVRINSVFAKNNRVSTVIVPELQCEHGSVKPNAQKVTSSVRITFDLSKVEQNTRCSKMCIYPFIRARISGGAEETFKGREWCGTVAEAHNAIIGPSSSTSYIALCMFTMILSIVIALL
ncbi:hypothetical protein QR680_003349 [Steinernema hermaphroditum]|uniref:Uncharacterized protein n=1 Tax=Steinernema hermaphroditum TaxID=289476 RepID=A0AA39H6E0_9BILA|nr:hypothetical protein QR680_003349 [Steinernema hermaphroditum]